MTATAARGGPITAPGRTKESHRPRRVCTGAPVGGAEQGQIVQPARARKRGVVTTPPRAVLHLPDPIDVVTIKGTAEAGPPMRDRFDLCGAYRAKYDTEADRRWLPDAPGLEEALTFTVTPRRAIAFQAADADVWTKGVWVAPAQRN